MLVAVCFPSRVDFHYNSTMRIRRNQTLPFDTNGGGEGRAVFLPVGVR